MEVKALDPSHKAVEIAGEVSVMRSRLCGIFGDLLPFLFPVNPHTLNTLFHFTVTDRNGRTGTETPIPSRRNG